mgnify:CR=1 FL=1
MVDAKKERYKRIRGAILKLLAHQHPGTLDCKVLHFLLDDLKYTISDEEFQSHISYLEQKGFAQKETRKTSGVEIEMVAVTPHGLDVLDGFVEDVGVDVRF